MATVAFDGKLLAVDKASWSLSSASGTGNGIWNATARLFELRPQERQKLGLGPEGGAWIAFMGAPGFVNKVHEWLVGLSDAAPAPQDKDDTIGIIVTSAKTVYRLSGWYSLEKSESLPFAAGAAEQIALGAMLAGASAVMALALTARRAPYVAAGIDHVNIETGTLGVLDFEIRAIERKA
jgi:hypothetical protein